MPFLLGKNGAIPVAPVNTYIENALVFDKFLVIAVEEKMFTQPEKSRICEARPRQHSP